MRVRTSTSKVKAPCSRACLHQLWYVDREGYPRTRRRCSSVNPHRSAIARKVRKAGALSRLLLAGANRELSRRWGSFTVSAGAGSRLFNKVTPLSDLDIVQIWTNRNPRPDKASPRRDADAGG